MTVKYDTSIGIIGTAFRLHMTVIPMVLQKPEFYLLLGVNLGLYCSVCLGYFNPGEEHAWLYMKLTSVTGSLMTFFVVFYNGNVYTRYQRLYELTKGMIENSIFIVAVADRDIKSKALIRKLTRWLVASNLIFFFERTINQENPEDGPISASEWDQLEALGLVEPLELEALRAHCKRLKSLAMPSFQLLHWSMKLYRVHSPRIPDLDKTYFTIRKCQEDVVETLEMPMPFQYFHIMNFMLLLNLSLWSYSLGILSSYFAPFMFIFAQLMFQGLRELSIALSDPFGDDATDFPMNEWMTGMYQKVYSLCEDDYDLEVEPGSEPLLEIGLDARLLDNVITAAHSQNLKRRKEPKKAKETVGAMTTRISSIKASMKHRKTAVGLEHRSAEDGGPDYSRFGPTSTGDYSSLL